MSEKRETTSEEEKYIKREAEVLRHFQFPLGSGESKTPREKPKTRIGHAGTWPLGISRDSKVSERE